ncbi:MAG: hypothetical protein IJC83_02130 [Oscillospiraceae bacterium]|nr:hypothetical protein [Oscillospiraceae bacterium]
MADYKKMYSVLFNAITTSIDILQKAQAETEEMFISADDTPVSISVVSEIAKQNKNEKKLPPIF